MVLAAVAAAHGIGGEVKVKLFTDDLAPFRVVMVDGVEREILSRRPVSGGAILKLSGVTDRTAAESLRGQTLSVSRDALPPLDEGEYYHADLIGLAAVGDDGAALGTVVAVDNFGAGDVIEIERSDGKRFMVPMTEAAVPEWNETRLIVSTDFIE